METTSCRVTYRQAHPKAGVPLPHLCRLWWQDARDLLWPWVLPTLPYRRPMRPQG